MCGIGQRKGCRTNVLHCCSAECLQAIRTRLQLIQDALHERWVLWDLLGQRPPAETLFI